MGMPLEASDQWNSENREIDKRKEEREMREFVVYSLYLLFLHNCLFIAVPRYNKYLQDKSKHELANYLITIHVDPPLTTNCSKYLKLKIIRKYIPKMVVPSYPCIIYFPLENRLILKSAV